MVATRFGEMGGWVKVEVEDGRANLVDLVQQIILYRIRSSFVIRFLS